MAAAAAVGAAGIGRLAVVPVDVGRVAVAGRLGFRRRRRGRRRRTCKKPKRQQVCSMKDAVRGRGGARTGGGRSGGGGAGRRIGVDKVRLEAAVGSAEAEAAHVLDGGLRRLDRLVEDVGVAVAVLGVVVDLLDGAEAVKLALQLRQ